MAMPSVEALILLVLSALDGVWELVGRSASTC